MIDGNSEMPTQDNTGTQTGNSGNGYALITKASNDAYLKAIDLKRNGERLLASEMTWTPAFDATKYSYVVELDSTIESVDIEGIAHNETAIVSGNKTVTLDYGESEVVTLQVTSGLNTTKTYTVTLTRKQAEGSTLLKSLSIDGATFSPSFDKNTKTYDVVLKKGAIDTQVLYAKFDNDATVTITDEDGNAFDATDSKKLFADSGTINVKVEKTGVVATTYVLNWTKDDGQTEFAYDDEPQKYIAPISGYYKIELWGAEGGAPNNSKLGGNGAYTSGNIWLNKDEVLWVYIGEHREGNASQNYATYNDSSSTGYVAPSFNAGSVGGPKESSGYGGGGATDVRLVNGKWYDETSLASRIMVAAGGGGHAVPTKPLRPALGGDRGLLGAAVRPLDVHPLVLHHGRLEGLLCHVDRRNPLRSHPLRQQFRADAGALPPPLPAHGAICKPKAQGLNALALSFSQSSNFKSQNRPQSASCR